MLIYIKHRTCVLLLLFGFAGLALFPVVAGAQEISLEQAIGQALRENPALQAMKNQAAAANYRVKESFSGHLPRLSVSGGYTLYEEPNIIFPIHQQGVFPPLDDRIFESSAQINLPLFSGGKVVASTQAVKAERNLIEAGRQSAQTEILSAVADLFLNALELKDRGTLVQARIDALQQRFREMEALSGEGRVSSADQALILSAIENARGDSLQVAGHWGELGWRLGQTLGQPEPVYPLLNDLDMQADLSSELAQFKTDQSMNDNANLIQAQARVRQAEALQSLNQRRFLPDLSGFAVYNYRSGGSDWDPDGEWAAGLRLSIPVFEGGKRFAGLQASKASLKSAQQNLTAVAQAEHALLQVALSQWQTAGSHRARLNQAVEHKRQFVTAQQAVYDAGRLPLSALMTQESELLQMEIQEKSQAYLERKNAVKYFAAAGKLNEQTLYTILGRKNYE